MTNALNSYGEYAQFIFHILARNLLEGLLEISKHYINDKWVDYNIEALMKYHVHGMAQFFT